MRIGNIYFVLELLLAELIFLYPVPKRSHFFARLLVGFAVVTALCAFMPQITVPELKILDALLRFLGIFGLTVATMAALFRIKASTMLFMCSAGYAVQHMAYRIGWLMAQIPLFPRGRMDVPGGSRVAELTAVVLVYLIILATFGRFSAQNECYRNEDIRFNAVSAMIIFICIGLSRLHGLFGDTMDATTAIYSIVCCILALYVQFNLHRGKIAEQENTAIQQMWKEEAKQYESTKNAMEAINISLHDLKHKLNACQGLPQEEYERLKDEIGIYDSKLETGSEALNVLLYDKRSRCRREGILLSCSGNFALLNFMKIMDLYSLFGNAIDNAIEAVERVEQPEQRIIDVSMEQKGELLFISVTNYFSGKLNTQGGLPLTSKTDAPGQHGYGLKSMKLIAEKYGGELAISVKENLFCLSIYLRMA